MKLNPISWLAAALILIALASFAAADRFLPAAEVANPVGTTIQAFDVNGSEAVIAWDDGGTSSMVRFWTNGTKISQQVVTNTSIVFPRHLSWNGTDIFWLLDGQPRVIVTHLNGTHKLNFTPADDLPTGLHNNGTEVFTVGNANRTLRRNFINGTENTICTLQGISGTIGGMTGNKTTLYIAGQSQGLMFRFGHNCVQLQNTSLSNMAGAAASQDYAFNVSTAWARNSSATGRLVMYAQDTIAPTPFNLTSPGNKTGINGTFSTNRSPCFSWTATSEVNFKNYTLELINKSMTGTADNNVSISNGTIGSVGNTTKCIGTLEADLFYSWRVIAWDLAGNSRASTEVFQYVTDNTAPTMEGCNTNSTNGTNFTVSNQFVNVSCNVNSDINLRNVTVGNLTLTNNSFNYMARTTVSTFQQAGARCNATMFFQATDAAENTANVSVNVTVIPCVHSCNQTFSNVTAVLGTSNTTFNFRLNISNSTSCQLWMPVANRTNGSKVWSECSWNASSVALLRQRNVTLAFPQAGNEYCVVNINKTETANTDIFMSSGVEFSQGRPGNIPAALAVAGIAGLLIIYAVTRRTVSGG